VENPLAFGAFWSFKKQSDKEINKNTLERRKFKWEIYRFAKTFIIETRRKTKKFGK